MFVMNNNLCRFSDKKMKIEDILAFVRSQTNAFNDSFISPSVEYGSQPQIY